MTARMELLEWNLPENAVNLKAIQLRNGFARKLASAPAQEVCREYTHFSPHQIQKLLRTGERLLGRELAGTGIELGAGTAVVASVLAARKNVDRVYAVECVGEVVRCLQPKVIQGVLGLPNSYKVTRVIGSFDFLELPDETLDFAVEIESWHHSDNLDRSVAEAFRVLRPNGVVLGFDRFQPDDLADEEVRALLDIVYDREFLERNGYPLDLTLTRRSNGEHEYRRREWMAAFHRAGFRKILVQPLERSADSLSNSILRWCALAPSHKPKFGSPWHEIKRWVKQRIRQAPYSPKSFTCFALVK